MTTNTTTILEKLQQSLQTVYDPDFPLVDIYTLGLIYDIKVDETEERVDILMSFTTPACPMADYLIESCKNAALLVVPEYEVFIEVTFDPMWSPKMIRDEDLQRMFE
ncbi:MAG: FeS assembly SUF system protein [candidate division SR1 bacterium]|nr:MAG: FeS assembly SUF system protein [candidate division SR1 bacterium]